MFAHSPHTNDIMELILIQESSKQIHSAVYHTPDRAKLHNYSYETIDKSIVIGDFIYLILLLHLNAYNSEVIV